MEGLQQETCCSSPNNSGAMNRRRKTKRPTPILGSSGIPGSSLSGLNRTSIRVVNLSRGTVGYGFTISGQKPCLLRCIVEGSPAQRANLRPGNCLVGVNGKDVSHLAHDQVVAMIGKCTALLRLHVADSYFSESSDEESLQVFIISLFYNTNNYSLIKFNLIIDSSTSSKIQ
jgi:hypothetical protein